jgi:hypothetical protein
MWVWDLACRPNGISSIKILYAFFISLIRATYPAVPSSLVGLH